MIFNSIAFLIFNSNSKREKVKKYPGGFFFLILFLFLFDRGLFYLVSSLESHFYPKGDFEKKFEGFVKNKNFSTLIFGTSRAYEGIHPNYIEKALNQKAFKETFQGKGPKYNFYFYQLYKKYAGIPKVVIFGVDYFIYSITSDSKWMAQLDIKNEEEKINVFSSPLLLVEHKKKIDNFLNNILIYFKERREPIETNNWDDDFIKIQNYTGRTAKDKKLVTRPHRRFRQRFFPSFPGKEGRYFIKLLDELDRDGVIVVLVALPDYIGTYKTNFQHKDFIRHLKQLGGKYKNLYVYNYNHPNRFPLTNPDYFNDGGYGKTNSHLSQKGAKLFNEILVEDLRKHYQADN